MKKRFRGFLYFALSVMALVLSLVVINWVPLAIDRGVIRKYGSIEEVRSRLKLKEIYVPSYFPRGLLWPPSEILAQDKPYRLLQMKFRGAGTGDVALVISQSELQGFRPDDEMKMEKITSTAPHAFKGRRGSLETGFCGRQQGGCSRISWAEGPYRLTVVVKSQPSELIKIAESMVEGP